MARQKQKATKPQIRAKNAARSGAPTAAAPVKRVILPVEAEPGRLINVTIAQPVKSWNQLRPNAWAKAEAAGHVLVHDHFHHLKIVHDAARARVDLAGPVVILPCSPANGSEPIVVLLESPHKDEFDKDFKPLWPLNRTQSLKNMCSQLKRLTEEAGLEWAALLGKQVVLVNPVPLQTSMARFYNRKGEALKQSLRDQVWSALYDSVPFFESDLIRRLGQYKPVLILNGCTRQLQDRVQKTLNALPFRSVRVSAHPSMWCMTHLL